jgi:hypothetical protein
MEYKSIKKPDKCPECGSDKIADILYGLSAFSPSLKKEIEDHRIVLGVAYQMKVQLGNVLSVVRLSRNWRLTLTNLLIKKRAVHAPPSFYPTSNQNTSLQI